ncbi:MAG: phage portal protein [Pyrinomonadaceae bacterium]
MNKDIEKALTNLRVNATRYTRVERYYNGDHDLAFATEKFQNTFGSLFREFALNLCPVICDAVRDKLRITGFSVEDQPRGGTVRLGNPGEADDAPLAEAARVIWHRNRMDRRSGQIHKEALRGGDAYAIVWPDDSGRAAIYPNRSTNITVVYDEDLPGQVAWAAKGWRSADKRTRLNLFYRDRIEKYISRRETEGSLPETSDLVPLDPSPAVVPNPYGIVPVFHFANNADLGLTGRSELEPAIPVQDGLNKSVLDMLVAMEFSAFRQRWATGIEVNVDAEGKPVSPFKAGVDHVWVSNDAGTKFGDFDAAELEQFLKVKDSFRVDMASVTGTPLHYFMQSSGDFPSGESLKKSETRFLAKVRDRQESFGQVWAEMMSFALMIEGRGPNISLLTQWEDASPMSEREVLENILLKKQIGLPVEQALVEAGYGTADVKRMTPTE